MGNWGWHIIAFLFFGGLGSGAYLASFAAEKGLFGKENNLERAGYFISGPCLAVGLFLFSMNLGVSITGMLTMIGNPTSVMTWGVYLLFMFMVLAFWSAYHKRENKKVPAIISGAGALLAVTTALYTGGQLSVLFAQPFWNTLLVPGLFVVSALIMGLASSSLLARIIEKPVQQEGVTVNRVNIILLFVELVLLLALLLISFSGAKGPVAADSARIVVAGRLAPYFWTLLIAVGLVFPLLNSFYPKKKRNEKSGRILGLLSEMATLIGGATLRAIVVLSALPIWNI
ncbi:MAG TPA: polysulfide reductase NrfD [Desulfitobacterium dehalogenans]|uniref:Polysulfide reductase NrfD n=1 Tax=Desulfitobacterium dehalogenans TaxID=36854 RepID=A0A7C6Z2E4_9FIRM|nr:polysulfide reductase NrfD [Desulfitobacterium dehalogenans]